jgi:hypothetical protein
VAVLLPILISVAAIGSQFSASVADTSGAGGLVVDIAREKIPVRYAYMLILIVTIFLTWATDVNGIIAYASRAFALFYTLQSAVAAIVAMQSKSVENHTQKATFYSVISLLCLMVFLFGVPSA